MLQLELGTAEEASLMSQAERQGLSPEVLATRLVRAGLRPYVDHGPPSEEEQARRRAIIESMKEARKGRTLNRGDMSLKDFIHLGHKY